MKKLKLIENAKHWWKMWSVRFYILIAIAPDVYNSISALGWLDEAPKPFVWTIRILCVIGIVSRLVKQNNLEKKNDIKPD